MERRREEGSKQAGKEGERKEGKTFTYNVLWLECPNEFTGLFKIRVRRKRDVILKMKQTNINIVFAFLAENKQL